MGNAIERWRQKAILGWIQFTVQGIYAYERSIIVAVFSDYICDMRTNVKFGCLLALLIEQFWHPKSVNVSRKCFELSMIKGNLEEHYKGSDLWHALVCRMFLQNK